MAGSTFAFLDDALAAAPNYIATSGVRCGRSSVTSLLACYTKIEKNLLYYFKQKALGPALYIKPYGNTPA
jgi:hypothetical protein